MGDSIAKSVQRVKSLIAKGNAAKGKENKKIIATELFEYLTTDGRCLIEDYSKFRATVLCKTYELQDDLPWLSLWRNRTFTAEEIKLVSKIAKKQGKLLYVGERDASVVLFSTPTKSIDESDVMHALRNK